MPDSMTAVLRVLSGGLLGALLLTGCQREPTVVTYNEHIGPLMLNRCASCHRPGEAAPFSLLTYEDAKKRTSQIAEVTAKRYMPPWLPEPGPLKFEGDRSLTEKEIRLIQRWAESGAVQGEGKLRGSGTPARTSNEWQLGRPDLIVTMPEAYELPASGHDVYRNFIIPVPLTSNRLVRAFEFKPGGSSVHHAFVRIDRGRESRRLDAKDPEPGFGGMHTPPTVQSPEGFFLSWQPGKVVRTNKHGLSWMLEKNSDLVLQVHMQPAGKPERVQCSVGLYFTDKPSPLLPMKVWMRSFDIDIPAGASHHLVEESYVLPVPVEVLAILPHAHYLGREMHGRATLPDGTELPLLSIKQWDFNWQGEYQYQEPVKLPKGTRVSMHYSYDNSTNNARNPNHPPQPVKYGVQSTDEMGELWLQVLVANTNDQQVLMADAQKQVFKESLAYNQYLLRLNPADARAHTDLGKTLLLMGRRQEAHAFLVQAIALGPDLDDPHYYLGLLFRIEGALENARKEFEAATQLNPENAKAHGNLGLVLAQLGDAVRARQHLSEALRLNPEDEIAKGALQELSAVPAPRNP
jgi:hypothetical protein